MEIEIGGGSPGAKQLQHNGTSPDSVRIGDGTDVLDINADGSIKVTSTTGTALATEATIAALNTKIPSQINGGLPVQVMGAQVTLNVDDTNIAISNLGTEETGVSYATGASGILGWLSSIYRKLTQTLTVSGSVSVSNFPATQPVSGTVSVSNLAATQTVSGTVDTNTPLDKVATGTLTNINDAVTIASNGSGSVGAQISGTWAGTLQFEGTTDGTNYFSVNAFNRTSTAVLATSTTSNVSVIIQCAGCTYVRVRRSVATSGTATVALAATVATGAIIGASQNANNFLMAAAQTGTWNVRTQDGSGNALAAKNVTGVGYALYTTTASSTAVNIARISYASTTVSTSAYTTLLASTSALVTEVEIFDSSGQTMVLATGAAAAEVDQVYIFPGGNGRIPLRIATATRVAVKAISGGASSGELTVNFYG